MHHKTEDSRKKQIHEIMDKTQSLVEYIQNSDDYIRYQRELADLKANEKLYERMNEYRRKSLSLEMLGDSSANYEKVQDLYSEYKDFLNHPLVARFMISEQTICKTIRKVQNVFFEELDLDISYIE